MKSENLYWIWLADRLSVASKRLLPLLETFGTPFEIFNLSEEELSASDSVSEDLAHRLADKSLEKAYQTIDYCTTHQIGILSYADPYYPSRLKNLQDPPAVLYYKGTLMPLDNKVCIAVVGTRKMSEYGLQMREKQKAKRYYGILEKQFKNYFVKADKKEGQTGENLLTMIERRLDNVVYRMGMADSRREARQLVRHGHFRVNGRKVDIPSYITKKGDVITLREQSRKSARIKMLVENISARSVPAWITMDKENIQATINALPARTDIDFPIEEHLIVELYSK